MLSLRADPWTPDHGMGFEAVAEEAAMSRLYGGIHYPMGNENGLSQGQCVGQTVLAELQTLRR